MTKPTEHDAFAQLERAIKATREANGDDFLRDLDDLAPSRPWVWLVCLFAIAAIAMALTGCGGGIDTPDEMTAEQRADSAKCCPPDIQCVCKTYPG